MPVFKNKDNGTWYVMARYVNWKGERKQKCKRGFATKKEAQDKKGYASACLNYAKQIAKENNCYKMMLLTGSKEESTLRFYRNAGYNSSDKTAFIQWIDM